MQNLPKIPGLAGLRIPKEIPKDLTQKLLEADSAGHEMHRLYEKSHFALAGLVPVAFLSGEGSVMTRLCDLGLGVILPFHSHVAMNAVISDYIPYAYRMPARYGLLGASGVAALGLLKLNLLGPGLTDTVRSLWRHEKQQPPLKKVAKAGQ
eukprot:jgi/Ulvmu1/4034/UM019_0011.1